MTSLVANYGTSSGSSDSETESSAEESSEATENKITMISKLPKPDFLTSISSEGKCSVFSNIFTQEEMAKKAILEKHVKMVSTPDKSRMINGKNICWNYRKGRCRFGHNCKFAHDSDLMRTEEELLELNKVQTTILCETTDVMDAPYVLDLNEHTKDKKRKKRPGLSQTLIPSKKVMKMYMTLQK